MKIFLVYIILISSCFICYFDSLNGDFVFDDSVAIVKNRDVIKQNISIQSIFKNDFWGYKLTDPTSHKSYRPLTTLMFRFEYGYLKLNSYYMKLINLLLHCLNTCLLYHIFLDLTKNVNLSLFGCILFGVHPIHTEVVCGIVGRAELMFCLCLLISLLIFSTFSIDQKSFSEDWFKILFLTILAFIGLLFKENAIAILPICICYDIVMRTNIFQNLNIRFHVKKIVIKRISFLILLVSVLIIGRLYIQDFESPKFKPMDNPIASNDSIVTRVLSQNYLYVLNSWILICPHWLSYDWAVGCIDLITNIFDYRCLTILIFYMILINLLKNGSRLVFFAIGVTIIGFLPASGLIKVGFVIAERVLYIPSIGFCLLIANAFCLLQENIKKTKMIFNVLCAFLLYIFIMRARQRAMEWMKEDTLFISGLNVCPKNAKVHYNIARIATDQGDKKNAVIHYHKAISLYPDYEAALMNLGNLYREIGDFETAEKYLKRSINVLEEFPAAWMNLGIVQAQRKNLDDALISYQKALTYKKNYPTCLYNIGNLYLEQKMYSEAMKYWQQSVLLKPKQPKAWANILKLLDDRQLYEDALRTSHKALSYIGNDPTILFIRANIFGKLQNYIDAEQIYLKIIKSNPRNALYHTNLGVLYQRWKKDDLAIKYYELALKIDPNLKHVKEYLRKLLNKRINV